MKRSFLNRASALMLSVLMFVNTSASTVLAATGGEEAAPDVIERIQELDDEVLEQNVPVGTKLYQLNFPKTIRAVVVDHAYYESDMAYSFYSSIAPTEAEDGTKAAPMEISEETIRKLEEKRAEIEKEEKESDKSDKTPEKSEKISDEEKTDSGESAKEDSDEEKDSSEMKETADDSEGSEEKPKESSEKDSAKDEDAEERAEKTEAKSLDDEKSDEAKAEKTKAAETASAETKVEVIKAGVAKEDASKAEKADEAKSDKTTAEDEKAGQTTSDEAKAENTTFVETKVEVIKADEAKEDASKKDASKVEKADEAESDKTAAEDEKADGSKADPASADEAVETKEDATKADVSKTDGQKTDEKKDEAKEKSDAKDDERNKYWDQDVLDEYFDGLLDGSISRSEAPRGMTLRPVTVKWVLDPDQSVTDEYDPETSGTYVFRAEVKSKRLTLGDGASLPEITVNVDDGSLPFEKTVRRVNSGSGLVNVTVNAEAGVIPAGTKLDVRAVNGAAKKTVRGAVEEGIGRYAEEEYLELPEIEKLYSFEVRLTDKEGSAVAPDTGAGDLRITVTPVEMNGIEEEEFMYQVYRLDSEDVIDESAERNDGVRDPDDHGEAGDDSEADKKTEAERIAEEDIEIDPEEAAISVTTEAVGVFAAVKITREAAQTLEFNKHVTVDGVRIEVNAPAGVFPAGSSLKAERISGFAKKDVDQAIREKIGDEEGEASDGETEEKPSLVKTYVFDISILDRDGNPVQPDTSLGEVSVRFSRMDMSTVKKGQERVSVFHLDDEKNAEQLPAAVDTALKAVEVKADHFSEFAVAFLTAVNDGLSKEFTIHSEAETDADGNTTAQSTDQVKYAISDVSGIAGTATEKSVSVEFGVKVPSENGEDPEILEVKDGAFTLPASVTEFTVIARADTTETPDELDNRFDVSFHLSIDSVKSGGVSVPVRYTSAISGEEPVRQEATLDSVSATEASFVWIKSNANIEVKYLCGGEEIAATERGDSEYAVSDRLSDGGISKETAPKIYKYEFTGAELQIEDNSPVAIDRICKTSYSVKGDAEAKAIDGDAVLILSYKKKEPVTYTMNLTLYPENMNVDVPFKVTGFAEGESAEIEDLSSADYSFEDGTLLFRVNMESPRTLKLTTYSAETLKLTVDNDRVNRDTDGNLTANGYRYQSIGSEMEVELNGSDPDTPTRYMIQMPSQEGVLLDLRWNDNNNPKTGLVMPKLKLQYRTLGSDDPDAWSDVSEDTNGDYYFDAGVGSRKGLDLSDAELLTAEHTFAENGIGLQKKNNMSWEYKFVQKLYGYFYDDVNGSGQVRKVEYRLAVDGENPYLALDDGRKLFYTASYDTNRDRTENDQILVFTQKSDYAAVLVWGDNGDKYQTRPEMDHFPDGTVLTRTLDQTTEEAEIDPATGAVTFADGKTVHVQVEKTEQTADGENVSTDVITLPDAPGFDENNHPYVYTLKFPELSEEDKLIGSRAVTRFELKSADGLKLFKNVTGVYYGAYCENTDESNDSMNEKELYSGGKLHLSLTGKTAFTMSDVWNDANKYDGTKRPKYRGVLYRYIDAADKSFQTASPVPNVEQVALDNGAMAGDLAKIRVPAADTSYLNAFDENGNPYVYFLKLAAVSGGSLESGDSFVLERHAGNLADTRNVSADVDENGWFDAKSGSNFIYNGNELHYVLTGKTDVTVTEQWIDAARADKKATVTLKLQRRKLPAEIPAGADTSALYEEDSDYNSGDQALTEVLGPFNAETKKITSSKFTGLSRYDENGHEYQYYAIEEKIQFEEDGDKPAKVIEEDGKQYVLSNSGYRYLHTVSDDGKMIINQLVGDAKVYISKTLPNGVLPYTAESGEVKKLNTVMTFTVYRDGVRIGTVDYTFPYAEDASGNPKEKLLFTGDPTLTEDGYEVKRDTALFVDSYEKLTTRKDGLPETGAFPRYDSTGRQYHYTVSETAVKLTDGTDVKDLYHLDYSNTSAEGTNETVTVGTDIAEKYSLDRARFTNTKKVAGKADYTVTNRWIDGGDSMYHKRVYFALQYRENDSDDWTTVDKGYIEPTQQYVRRRVPDKATVSGAEVDLQAEWKSGSMTKFRVVETGIGFDRDTDPDNASYHYYGADSMISEKNARISEYPEYYLKANEAGGMDFAVTPDQNYAALPVAERNAEYDGGTYNFALTNRRIGLLYIDITNDWVDGHDHLGARPNAVIYHVNGDGSQTVAMEVKAEAGYTGDTWHYRSDALPKYKVSDGDIYHYNVRADHVTQEKFGETVTTPVLGSAFTVKAADAREVTYSNAADEEKNHYSIGAHHTGDVQEVVFENSLTETFELSVNKYWMDLGDTETVNRRPDIYMAVYRRYFDSAKGEEVIEPAGYFDNDWVMKSAHWWVNTFKNVPRYNSAGDEYTYYFVEKFQDNPGDYEIVGAFSGVPTEADNGFEVRMDGANANLLPEITIRENGAEESTVAAVFDSEKKASSTIVNRPIKERTIYGKKIWDLPQGTVSLSQVYLPTITIVLTRAEYKGMENGAAHYGPYEPCTEKYDENKNRISNMVDGHVEPMFVELTAKKDSYSFGPIPAYDRNGRLYKYQVIELSRLYKNDAEGADAGSFAAHKDEWPVLLSDERKAQADRVGKLYKEGDGTISEKTNSIALTNTFDPPLNYAITVGKTWEGFDNLTDVQKSNAVNVKFVLYRSVGMGLDGTPLTYETAKTWLKADEKTITIEPDGFDALAADGFRSNVTFDKLAYYGPDGQPYIYKVAEENVDTGNRVVGNAFTVLTTETQDGAQETVDTKNNTVPIINVKAPAETADGTDQTAADNGEGKASLINRYQQDLALTVKKEWKDGILAAISADYKPEALHVTVYRTADGYEPENIAEITLNDANGWTVTGEGVENAPAGAGVDERLSKLPKYAPNGAVYTYHAAENLSEDEDLAFHLSAGTEDTAEAENLGKLALPDDWKDTYTKRHAAKDVFCAAGISKDNDAELKLTNEFRLAEVTLSGKKLTDQEGTELTADQIRFADRFLGIPRKLTFQIAYTTDDLSDDAAKAAAGWKALEAKGTGENAGSSAITRTMTLNTDDGKYYGDGNDAKATKLKTTGLPRYILEGGVYREAHYRFFEAAMTYPDGNGGYGAPVERAGIESDGAVSGLLGGVKIGSVESTDSGTGTFAGTSDGIYFADLSTDTSDSVNRIPMRKLEIRKEWDDRFDRDHTRPEKLGFAITDSEESRATAAVELTKENVTTKAKNDSDANIWSSTALYGGTAPEALLLPVYRSGSLESAAYDVKEGTDESPAPKTYSRHQVKTNDGDYSEETDRTVNRLSALAGDDLIAAASVVPGDTLWFKNGRDADTIDLTLQKIWRFAGKDYDGAAAPVPEVLSEYMDQKALKLNFNLQFREKGTDEWKDVTEQRGFSAANAQVLIPAIGSDGSLTAPEGYSLTWTGIPVHPDNEDLASAPVYEFRMRETIQNRGAAAELTAKEVYSDPITADEILEKQQKQAADGEEKKQTLTVRNEFRIAALEVTKTWSDQENAFGTRPDAVLYEIQRKDGDTVRALTEEELSAFGYAGETVSGTTALVRGEKNNNYGITIAALPRMNKTGKTIEYRAVERGLVYADAEGAEHTVVVGNANGEGIYYTDAMSDSDSADKFAARDTEGGTLTQTIENTLSTVTLTGVKKWDTESTKDWNFAKSVAEVTFGVQRRTAGGSWEDVKTAEGNAVTKTAAHSGSEDTVTWSGDDGLPMYSAEGDEYEYRICERALKLSDQTTADAIIGEQAEVNGADISPARDRVGNFVISSDDATRSVKTGTGSFRSELTNTAITAGLKVKKTWEDFGDLDRLRPEQVTVTVKAAVTGSTPDTYTDIKIPASLGAENDGTIRLVLTAGDANADGEWEKTVSNLPVYDLNGNKIRYTVSELDTIEKYTASEQVTFGTDRKTPQQGNGYFAIAELNEQTADGAPTTVNFINNYGQNVVEIHVEKKWEGDAENVLGDRPDAVTVRLYASWVGPDGELTEPSPAVDSNGAAVSQVILTKDNDWKGGWVTVGTDLSSAGTMIYYSVREEVGDNASIDPEHGGYLPAVTDNGAETGYRYGVGVLQQPAGSGTAPILSQSGSGTYVLTNRMKSSAFTVTKTWSDETKNNRTGESGNAYPYGNIDPESGLPTAKLMLQRTVGTGLVPGSEAWKTASWTDVKLAAADTDDGMIALVRSGSESEETQTIRGVQIRKIAGANTVKVELTNLPKSDKDGNAYCYRVDERESAGYEATYLAESRTEAVINNRFERGDLTVTKVWEDESNRYHARPEKLKITVTPKIGADSEGNGGEKIAIDGLNAGNASAKNIGFREAAGLGAFTGNASEDGTVTLDAGSAESGDANRWTFTWKELPVKTPAGETITYVVTESGFDSNDLNGYQSVDGTVRAVKLSGSEAAEVTFTNVLRTTSFKVTKQWTDGYADPTAASRRVKSVLAVLERCEEGSTEWKTVKNGSPEREAEVSLLPNAADAGKDWSYTWTNLPTHSPGGRKYTYRAVESGLELARQNADGANVVVTVPNRTDAGVLNAYRFETTWDEADTSSGSADAKAGTITNTLCKGGLSVTKIWDDDENRDGIRPDAVTLHLVRKAGGKEEVLPENFDRKLEGQKAKTGDDRTTVSWDDLPVYDANGDAYEYRVTEDDGAAGGYTAVTGNEPVKLRADEVTAMELTNRHKPATTDIELRKRWNSQFHGARPDYVEFELTAHWTDADGTAHSEPVTDGAEKETTDEGDRYYFRIGENTDGHDSREYWTRTVKGLPLFKESMSGVPVTYEITEKPVLGYKTSYEKRATAQLSGNELRKLTADKDGNVIVPAQLIAVNTPETTDLTITVDWDNEIPVIAKSIDKVVFRLQRRHAGSDERWQYVWVTDERSTAPIEFEAEMPKVLGASRRNQIAVADLPVYDPSYVPLRLFRSSVDEELAKNMFEYRAVEDRLVLKNRAEVKIRNYAEGDFAGSYKVAGENNSEQKDGAVLGVKRYRSDWVNTSHAVKIAVAKKWTDESGKPEIGPDALEVTVSAHADGTAVDLDELTQTLTLTKENGWTQAIDGLPDETVEGYPVVYTIRETERGNYKASYEVSAAAEMHDGMAHSGEGSAVRFITGDNVSVTFTNSRVLNGGGGTGSGGSGAGGSGSGHSGSHGSDKYSKEPQGPAKEIAEKIKQDRRIITEKLTPEPLIEKVIRETDGANRENGASNSGTGLDQSTDRSSWRTEHRTPGTHANPQTGDNRQMKREAATAALAIFGLAGWRFFQKRFGRKDD